MWVKCPKCRFRFDQPGGDNGEEIQCVCPRCGTPFTFTANASDGLSKEAEKQKNGAHLHDEASPLHQSQPAYGYQSDRGETITNDDAGKHQASSFASNAPTSPSDVTSYDATTSSNETSSGLSSSGLSSSDYRQSPSYQGIQTPYNRSDASTAKVNICP